MRNDMSDEDSAEDEQQGGIDLARIKQIAIFFLRAPRRRPAVAAATCLGVLLLTVLLAMFMPRTYAAEIHVIAK